MFGWECWCWNGVVDPLDFCLSDSQPFSLPSPLPKWPPGKGFSTGRISLGEIEVYKISKLKKVWRCSQGAVFYKPQAIPDGFFCLGHYCQPSDHPLRGYVLVARGASEVDHVDNSVRESPALKRPVNYTLIWSSGLNGVDPGFIWLPNAPEGYRAMGFFRILHHKHLHLPNETLLGLPFCLFYNFLHILSHSPIVVAEGALSKTFQNRSVSSPAPDTQVSPSGLIAKYSTRDAWPSSSTALAMLGYFHTVI